MSFSGLATWCHPQPIHRSAHGTSALIWPWRISKDRGACNLPSGLARWFLFPVVSLWSPCQLHFSHPCFFFRYTFSCTVVCYQSDRDELRRRVIQWLEAEIIPDGWFSKGSNYSEVLDKYFKASRAVPASEAREHFFPCHCKAAAMSPPKKLQCVMGLSSWGPERSGMSYSMMCYGLPAAAADGATDMATGQPRPGTSLGI